MPPRTGPSHHPASLDSDGHAHRATTEIATGPPPARLSGWRRRPPIGISGVAAAMALTFVLLSVVAVAAADSAAAAQSVGMPPAAVNSLPKIVANLRNWVI